MQSDYFILLLVLGIALYIIIRIGSLRQWMRLNIEMRKGAHKLDSEGSYKRYELERRRAMSTKQHKLALRKAQAGRPGRSRDRVGK